MVSVFALKFLFVSCFISNISTPRTDPASEVFVGGEGNTHSVNEVFVTVLRLLGGTRCDETTYGYMGCHCAMQFGEALVKSMFAWLHAIGERETHAGERITLLLARCVDTLQWFDLLNVHFTFGPWTSLLTHIV